MTALLVLSPSSPVAGTTAIATATGGTAAKNRLLLNGTQVFTDCGDDAFTAGVTTSTVIATGQTLEWEQLIAGVWTPADDVTFDTVAGPTPSPPITSGTTIEDQTITLTLPVPGPYVDNGMAINRTGTSAASPITGLTIRRCTIRGGQWGIFLKWVDGFVIEDCLIEDVERAGIAMFSCLNGIVRRNTIRRIGYVRTDFSSGALNNAYGIMCNSNAEATGNLTTDPVCDDVEIYDNVIDWVPLWMGINSHGGNLINIHDNQTGHSPRGIFVAGAPVLGNPTSEPTNISIDSNEVYDSVTKSGGSTDKTGITYASWTGTSIQHNRIGASYGNNVSPYDFGGASTGVTTSDNTVVSGR